MASKGGGVVVFTEEELSEVSGLKLGGDYIEVTCGCTSRRYGDAVGRLRIFESGNLVITCDCTPGCQEGGFSIRSVRPSPYAMWHSCFLAGFCLWCAWCRYTHKILLMLWAVHLGYLVFNPRAGFLTCMLGV